MHVTYQKNLLSLPELDFTAYFSLVPFTWQSGDGAILFPHLKSNGKPEPERSQHPGFQCFLSWEKFWNEHIFSWPKLLFIKAEMHWWIQQQWTKLSSAAGCWRPCHMWAASRQLLGNPWPESSAMVISVVNESSSWWHMLKPSIARSVTTLAVWCSGTAVSVLNAFLKG